MGMGRSPVTLPVAAGMTGAAHLEIPAQGCPPQPTLGRFHIHAHTQREALRCRSHGHGLQGVVLAEVGPAGGCQGKMDLQIGSIIPPNCLSYPQINIASDTAFQAAASGKEPTCPSRRWKRHAFDPWVRKIPWRRAWQPTPVLLPGEFHGQRSLADYSP